MQWNYERPYSQSAKWWESAPIVRVRIYHPGEEDLSATLEGLLDSGGPTCLMPADLPNDLILYPAGDCEIHDVNSGMRKSPVYYPALKLEGWDLEFPAVRFAVWNGDYAVLGRSLVNRFYLALDGPNRRLMIRQQ